MSHFNEAKIPARRIGYARISTSEQLIDLQVNALKQYGCDEIFCDEGVSGSIHPLKRGRAKAAISSLQKGDILVVWKLDRLGRSLKNVLDTIDNLKDNEIQFVSLTENIDTTTATGRAFLQITGIFSELERNLISERTREGLKAARRRGVTLGRRRKLSDSDIHAAHIKIAYGYASAKDIAMHYGVSFSTLKRGLDRLELSPLRAGA